MAACGDSNDDNAPVVLATDPAPTPAPSVVASDTGVEQAADDYTDSVVAASPDPIYDMAAAALTTKVTREDFDTAWTRCHQKAPENYDVTNWAGSAKQATVFTDADGVHGSFLLRFEDGKWRWQPTTTELAYYTNSGGTCP